MPAKMTCSATSHSLLKKTRAKRRPSPKHAPIVSSALPVRNEGSWFCGGSGSRVEGQDSSIHPKQHDPSCKHPQGLVLNFNDRFRV